MEKDTLRLLITKECNLNCKYCCNKNIAVKEKIKNITCEEYVKIIQSGKYKNLCITGGEPMLEPGMLFEIIQDGDVFFENIYLYTNGLLIDRTAYILLAYFKEAEALTEINIGLHEPMQYFNLYSKIGYLMPRFHIEQSRKQEFSEAIKVIENYAGSSIKYWERDVCDVPNEDWMALTYPKKRRSFG